MEFILIGTAVAGVALFVMLFLRSAHEAREESDPTARSDTRPEGFEMASGAASGIFSGEDEEFIEAERDPLLVALFRRERKRLALRWVDRRKLEASAIMRRHREASRAAEDLQPSDEVALMVRHAKLRLTCEILSVSVWMIGPQGLQRLAARAHAIQRSMRNLNALADRSERKISV